jgi:hypothetical protein
MVVSLIVSLIAIGSVVLLGVLGYLADKSSEDDNVEPAPHEALEKPGTTEVRGSGFDLNEEPRRPVR